MKIDKRSAIAPALYDADARATTLGALRRTWLLFPALLLLLPLSVPAHSQTGQGLANLTMTTVTQTINPSGPIDLAAQITSGDGGPVPTGEIIFHDETTDEDLGTADIDSTGVASKTVTGVLTLGGHNIDARYAGSTLYAPVESQPVTINVEKSTTTTTVTPATSTPASGASLLVTATITAVNPGATPPSGIVSFSLDGIPEGSPSVTEGTPSKATITITAPASGSHNLQAFYSGDNNYDNSTSTVAIIKIASKGATVTTLKASPAQLSASSTETLTATVSPSVASGSQANITGSITFYDGTISLGDPVPINLISGVYTAVLSGVNLSADTVHTLTAVYSGDSNWLTSTSPPVTLQASLLRDTVSLAVSIDTLTPGQTTTLTATVTPAIPPAAGIEAYPTGNIIFYDGDNELASAALAPSLGYAATATYIAGALPPGKNTLTARYLGDLYYQTGTSNPVTIDVQDFSIVPDPSNPPGNLTIVQGSSGSATFDVQGLGGFNNQIQVVCAVPGGLDMSCNVNPQLVAPPGKVVVTVGTFSSGTASAANRRPPLEWLHAAGGTVLACVGFLLLPLGRRSRRFGNRRWFMMLLLVGLCAAGIGCSNSTVTVGSGTPLGVATLKITGAANVPNTTVSHSVYLSVNVVAK